MYFGGRLLIEGEAVESSRNARRILDVEAALGLDIEHSTQDLVLKSDVLRTVGNLSYVWLHWPCCSIAVASDSSSSATP